MYAKLVTNASVNVSANVFFNNLIGVITGTITSNSGLDATTFNQAASQVNTTVSAGWTNIDPQANTPANTYILSGCAPVVIQAPWTDSGSNYKTLWIGQINSVNSTFNIVALPAENWSNTTKTSTNIYLAPNTVFSAGANNSSFARNWFDVISPMSSTYTQQGTVTIVSASQAHLFVASYQNLTGTNFNNYFYVSEYSRDDPWSTVSNGYPSWMAEGTSNNNGVYVATATQQSMGVLPRILNTVTGSDANMVPMATSTSLNNWGVSTRFWPWVTTPAFRPYGLGYAATSNTFIGNQNYYRDSGKNAASTISEMRVSSVAQGTTLTSNTMFAGGSINAVAPYVYAFRSQWLSLDEVDYSGARYVNLILNTSAVGQTNASCILIKEN